MRITRSPVPFVSSGSFEFSFMNPVKPNLTIGLFFGRSMNANAW